MRSTREVSALFDKKAVLEEILGEPAAWDEKPGKKSVAVYLQSQFKSLQDVEQWPVMLDRLMDTHARTRAALDAIGGVSSLI